MLVLSVSGGTISFVTLGSILNNNIDGANT